MFLICSGQYPLLQSNLIRNLMLRLYSSNGSNLKTGIRHMMATAINVMKNSSITIAVQNVIGISNINTCILRYATIMVDDQRFMMESSQAIFSHKKGRCLFN